MPWLYFNAKPEIQAWAKTWQHAIHEQLRALEHVEVAKSAFIAEDASLFAEPNRPIRIGPESAIASMAYLHGPIHLDAHVSINPRTVLDGGRAGIHIGEGTRIATGVTMFAFNHGMAPQQPIRQQPNTSKGIKIGPDVWIGANVGITDGVTIGAHAVVGMGAVVTHDVPDWAIVAGVPAKVIGDRRQKTD